MTFSNTPPSTCCEDKAETCSKEYDKEYHIDACSTDEEKYVKDGAGNQEHS